MFLCFEQFEDVESKTFMRRLSVERVELSIPTTSLVLPRRLGLSNVVPEAHSGPDGLPDKNRLRFDAAARCGVERPGRQCEDFAFEGCHGGRQDEQWPGPQRQGQKSSLQLGALRIEILGKMFEIQRKDLQSRGFPPQKLRKMLGSMITCSVLKIMICARWSIFSRNAKNIDGKLL